MTKAYIITAGISGFMVVVLGAIGSHLLSGKLDAEQLYAFRIAYQFQMFHTLAMLGLVFLNKIISPSLSKFIFYSFLTGILFFSVSIYLTATMPVTHLEVGFMHFLPPIGGLSFMAGWVAIFLSGWKYIPKNMKNN